MERDVRLTERQLYLGGEAVRRRMRQLKRSMEAAEEKARRGDPYQRGTYASHTREYDELAELHRVLKHNHTVLVEEFAEKVRVASQAPTKGTHDD